MQNTVILYALILTTFQGQTLWGQNNLQLVQDPQRAKIFSKLHLIHQKEIRAGQLAQARGTTAAVKRLGERLERDHRFADDQLIRFALDYGITLTEPVEESPEDKEQAAKLEKAHGKEFNELFLDGLEKRHIQTLSLLRSAREVFSDGATRRFLSKLIPIMNQHHSLARKVEDRLASAPATKGDK